MTRHSWKQPKPVTFEELARLVRQRVLEAYPDFEQEDILNSQDQIKEERIKLQKRRTHEQHSSRR